MKKTISILLLFVVILTALVGCKKRGDESVVTPYSDEASNVFYPTYTKFADDYKTKCTEHMKAYVDKYFHTLNDFVIVYLDDSLLCSIYGIRPANMFSQYSIWGEWETCVGSDLNYYQSGIIELDVAPLIANTPFSDIDVHYCDFLIDFSVSEKDQNFDLKFKIAENYEGKTECIVEDGKYYVYANYFYDSIEFKLEISGKLTDDFEYIDFSNILFEKLLEAVVLYYV